MDPRVQADVAAIARIGAVQSVLRVLLQLTGMRLAVVARVTDESWTCCAVLDETNFGLRPGDTLELDTIFQPLTRGEQPGGERRSIGLGLFIVDQILRARGQRRRAEHGRGGDDVPRPLAARRLTSGWLPGKRQGRGCLPAPPA